MHCLYVLGQHSTMLEIQLWLYSLCQHSSLDYIQNLSRECVVINWAVQNKYLPFYPSKAHGNIFPLSNNKHGHVACSQQWSNEIWVKMMCGVLFVCLFAWEKDLKAKAVRWVLFSLLQWLWWMEIKSSLAWMFELLH